MYLGAWAFSEVRKSVNHAPHITGTDHRTKKPCFKPFLFVKLQKPNKNQTAREPNKKPGSSRIKTAGRSRQITAVHFCQCSGLVCVRYAIGFYSSFFVFVLSSYTPTRTRQINRQRQPEPPQFRPEHNRQPNGSGTGGRRSRKHNHKYNIKCTKTRLSICAIFSQKMLAFLVIICYNKDS